MTDFAKIRAELKAHYHAAAKAAHPDMGGTAEQMATVNAAYDQALKDIAQREQEELAPAPQPKVHRGTWQEVPDDPSPPKEYPDTTKGQVHRAYDETGLSGAIELAKKLGVKPRQFKRWHEDFKFDAEWE